MNRVDNAAWISCLELSPTWFLKNMHNGNINKHNCNNNSNNVITRVKYVVGRWKEKKGVEIRKKITAITIKTERQRYKKKIVERPPCHVIINGKHVIYLLYLDAS